MNIEIVETLPDQHAKRVKELLRQCFSDAGLSDDERQERADRFCSRADTWRYVVALNGTDTVVGFATVYRRQIERNGASVALGGLGNVCTDPEWRHQGIASAVSAAAVEVMKHAKCDIAYLCAAVDDPGIVRLYGQCGFVPLCRPHTFFGSSGRLYEDSDAMIAPICSPAVYNAVLTSTEPFHIGIGNW